MADWMGARWDFRMTAGSWAGWWVRRLGGAIVVDRWAGRMVLGSVGLRVEMKALQWGADQWAGWLMVATMAAESVAHSV